MFPMLDVAPASQPDQEQWQPISDDRPSSIMAELADLDQQDAKAQAAAYLDFVREVGDGKLTDARTIKRRLADFSKSREELQEDLAQYDAYKADLALAATRQDVQSRLDEANGAVEAADTSIRDLESQIADLRMQLLAARAGQDDATAAVDRIRHELVEIGYAERRLREDALVSRFASPETAELQARIVALEHEANVLDVKLTAPEGSYRSHIQQLEQEWSDCQAKIPAHEEKLKLLERSINDTRSRPAEELVEERDDHKRKLEEIRGRITVIESEIPYLKEEAGDAKGRRDIVQQELDAARSRLSELLATA